MNPWKVQCWDPRGISLTCAREMDPAKMECHTFRYDDDDCSTDYGRFNVRCFHCARELPILSVSSIVVVRLNRGVRIGVAAP